MRIICLEEHLTDAALTAAAKPAIARMAPYMADQGSHPQDPNPPGTDRPRQIDPHQAEKLAAAPVDDRLATMDEHGIDMQLLSYSNPTQAAPVAQAADLAMRANDRLAEAVARHPDRFGGFCTLPWQDPDAATRELERCVRELGLPATLLLGRPDETVFLDDARYAPVLAKLEELQAPIYIHPGSPLPAVQLFYYAGFDKEVTARLSLFGWGWHNEAGIQVVRLILSGALDRHPGLRIISGHWGEMVPFWLQRLDDTMPVAATGLTRTVSQTYRDQVYVTPSGMLYPPHFRFVREVLGVERIMFSIDYPYVSLEGARTWLENLPIPDDERHAIAHGNAESLLRLKPEPGA